MKVGNKENDAGLSFGVIGLLVCAGFAFVVVAVVATFFEARPVPALPTQSQSNEVAFVRVSSGSGVLFDTTVSINASSTVFDALQAAAADKNMTLEYKTYPGMGVLVTKIGDSKSGAGGAYWQYWVNGEYATISADNTRINPNDVIEWKLTSSIQ